MKEDALIRLNTRVNILGVGANPIRMDDALFQIGHWIKNKQKHYVCVMPAHAVMDCFESNEIRSVFNKSGMVTPDGMAIVWLLKLHGYRDVERVYGPDLMLAALDASQEKGWKHFLFGGTEEVLRRLAQTVNTKFPKAVLCGHYSPPFGSISPDEEQRIIQSINQANADILWVGLGSPKQEKWMAENIKAINASVLIGVGAAFDFISGEKSQAPRWMQKSGLEWLFRLFSEPGRLWKRYIRYPKFAILAILQLMKIKNFPLEE